MALGVLVGVAGLYFFGSVFFTPSSEFFADPHGTIDHQARSSFLGIALISIAGLVTPAGGALAGIGYWQRSTSR